MDYYKLIIITFIVTACWDILLRYLSLNHNKIFDYIGIKMPYFIRILKPYFENHTMLSAALIAGFVGATTQPIILHFMKFPTLRNEKVYIFKFMVLSFIISGLYGFIMKASKLFPYLEKHYYEKLGTIKSIYHDGNSGIIVQFTILFLFFISDKLK